jgi:hypothetical protein
MIFVNLAFSLIINRALISKNNRIPVTRDGQIKSPFRLNSDIKVIRRSPCINRANLALPFSRYYLNMHLVLMEHLYFIFSILLIGRRIHLVCTSEIDP